MMYKQQKENHIRAKKVIARYYTLRNSMPFVGYPDAVDLFFEVLDFESQKKVLQDLMKGYTIKIPAYKGNKPQEINIRRIGEEKLFIKPFVPTHIVFKYDDRKKEYVFINK